MIDQRNKTSQPVSGGSSTCHKRENAKKMISSTTSAAESQSSSLTAKEKPHFSQFAGQPLSIRQCFVETVGLENFICTIIKELHLKMNEHVLFDMNSQGTLTRWDHVFRVKKTYTTCLGISHHTYTCHGYTHEPKKQLAYFILGEHNERSMKILPAFDFHDMIFCYYDSNGIVTTVDVQYDQMGFYMNYFGLSAMHLWCMRCVVTPFAMLWMNTYNKTGKVHPLTFLVQVLVTLTIFSYVVFQVVM